MPTASVQSDREQLFKILKKSAFFKEKITLSSGKESDYYFDARRVTLSPQGAYLSAKIILDMITSDRIDAIGGPTLGADPLVGALGVLSFQANTPLNTFIIRKAPKAHGKQQQVEGPLLPEKGKVILVDDVATTGKAFLQSIEVLRAMNISIVKAICIIDREEGAKEALAHHQCPLYSIFKASEFLKS